MRGRVHGRDMGVGSRISVPYLSCRRYLSTASHRRTCAEDTADGWQKRRPNSGEVLCTSTSDVGSAVTEDRRSRTRQRRKGAVIHASIHATVVASGAVQGWRGREGVALRLIGHSFASQPAKGFSEEASGPTQRCSAHDMTTPSVDTPPIAVVIRSASTQRVVLVKTFTRGSITTHLCLPQLISLCATFLLCLHPHCWFMSFVKPPFSPLSLSTMTCVVWLCPSLRLLPQR